jgi:hypothetical protein
MEADLILWILEFNRVGSLEQVGRLCEVKVLNVLVILVTNSE